MSTVPVIVAIFMFSSVVYSQNKERYDALHNYFSTKNVDYSGLIASLVIVAVGIVVIIIYQHNQHMKEIKKQHEDISKFHKEIIGRLSEKNDK